MEKAKKKKKVGSGTGKKDMAKSHAVHERLEAPGEKVGGKGAAGKNGPKGKGTSAPFKAGKKPKK